MYLSCSTLCFKLSDYPDIHDVLARIKGMGFAAVDLAAGLAAGLAVARVAVAQASRPRRPRTRQHTSQRQRSCAR